MSAASSHNRAAAKGFFDLPHELRIRVYDLLHSDSRTACHQQLTLQMPLHLAERISRRFNKEYEARKPQDCTLVISQHTAEFDPWVQETMVPDWYVPCRKVRFDFNVSDPHIDKEPKPDVGHISRKIQDLQAWFKMLQGCMPDVPYANPHLRLFINQIGSFRHVGLHATTRLMDPRECFRCETIEIWYYGHWFDAENIPIGKGSTNAILLAKKVKGGPWNLRWETIKRCAMQQGIREGEASAFVQRCHATLNGLQRRMQA